MQLGRRRVSAAAVPGGATLALAAPAPAPAPLRRVVVGRPSAAPVSAPPLAAPLTASLDYDSIDWAALETYLLGPPNLDLGDADIDAILADAQVYLLKPVRM